MFSKITNNRRLDLGDFAGSVLAARFFKSRNRQATRNSLTVFGNFLRLAHPKTRLCRAQQRESSNQKKEQPKNNQPMRQTMRALFKS
jgi:hypothetical protein